MRLPTRHRRQPAAPSSDPSAAARGRTATAGVGGLILALGLIACGADPPGGELPAGRAIAGDTAAWQRALGQVERLAGTPAAAAATVLARAVARCDRFAAFCPAEIECTLAEKVVCAEAAESDDPAAAALRLAAEAPLWVFVARPEGVRLAAAGDVAPDGSWRFTGQLAAPDGASAVSLLMPAADPPGPPRLAAAQRLAHARVRPHRGLAVDALIDPEGDVARLWRLQGELFSAVALGSSWEAAVYLPAEGQRMPGLALAVDVRRQQAAVEAMEAFLDDLQRSWPLRRSPWRHRGFAGTCLDNLNILPELAPCYLAIDGALVVGWNAPSVERALAGDAGPPPEASAFTVELAALPEADRRLRSVSGAELPHPPLVWPWRRLALRGERDGALVRWRLDLLAGEGAE